MHRPLRALSLSLPLAAAALPSIEAQACSPGPPNGPCWYYDQWSALAPVNAAAIPIDGVLVLQGAQTGPSPDDDWLDAIDLSVTRDGQPVAGALETTEVDDVLVWRPAAPLVPGATYQVTGSLDNPDEDPEGQECGPDLLPLAFEFHADAGPAALLAPAMFAAEASVVLTPQIKLAALVCCDGAMPSIVQQDDCAYVPEWSEGECASLLAIGRLAVTGKVGGVATPTLAMTSRRLVVDGAPLPAIVAGDPGVVRDAPACTRMIVRNLASGETVMSEETCHGQDLLLGEQAVDPSQELAALCSGAPYVCELGNSGWSWDAQACSAWPDGVGTTGDTTGDTDTGGDATGDTGTGGDTTGATGTGGDTTGDPGTGGTVTGEAETDGASSGAPTTGPAETGGTTTGSGGTQGDMTGSSGSPGDSTRGSDTGGQEAPVELGCGCDAGPGGDALALVGLVALARRRRRTR